MDQRQFEFDRSIAIDPSRDIEPLLKEVPARWAIYLMADASGRPVQLLSVKNLRYSLRRRLGAESAEEPAGKRVDLRQIVRRVSWRRVDSALEADWLYFEAAREIFPATYHALSNRRPAWFVHVDSAAKFPRFVKTNELTQESGVLLGPLPDKHAANRLIEDLTDWFDLCRYYNVLTEAPNGRACAYKEMGRCPAPCDGSVSMDHYRRTISLAVAAVESPQLAVEREQQNMRAAAGEQKFEQAARIKTLIESLSRLGTREYRHIRRLEDFMFLCVEPGPRKGLAKVLLVTPIAVEHICSCIGVPDAVEILTLARQRADAAAGRLDVAAVRRMGIVAFHLFAPADAPGVMLPLRLSDAAAVGRAYRQVAKIAGAEEQPGEGVVADLQAM